MIPDDRPLGAFSRVLSGMLFVAALASLLNAEPRVAVALGIGACLLFWYSARLDG